MLDTYTKDFTEVLSCCWWLWEHELVQESDGRLGYTCWSCGAWLSTLTKNRLRRSITQEELWGQVIVGVRRSGSPSWWLGGQVSGRVSRGLDYLSDSPSKDVLQTSVGELGVSDGGMFKYSKDRSESREEHSERQSKETSPRCNEAQRMQSSLETSRYRKLKPRVKGSLEMS